jgi:hypothetical protein
VGLLSGHQAHDAADKSDDARERSSQSECEENEKADAGKAEPTAFASILNKAANGGSDNQEDDEEISIQVPVSF